MAQDLWQLRRQKRMTIDELARTAGVHPALIKAYELGERAIPERDLERLAGAIEVDVEEIKELSDPPPRGPSRPAAPPAEDTEAPARSRYDSGSRFDSGSRYGGDFGNRPGYGRSDTSRSGFGGGEGRPSGFGGSEGRPSGFGEGEGRSNYGGGRPSYGEGEGRSGYSGGRSSGFGEGEGRSGYSGGRSSYGDNEGRSSYGGGRSNYGDNRSSYGEGRSSYGGGRSSYGDSEGRSSYGGSSDYRSGYGNRPSPRYDNDRSGMQPRPNFRQDRPTDRDRMDRRQDRPLKKPGLKRRPQVAPARPSQLEHLKILLQQLDMSGDDLLRLAGKPLSMLNRREASHLLTTCQEMIAERKPERPKGKRQRPYLPESVDEYELVYLTQVQLDGNPMQVTLFDGSRLEGVLQGFSPYALTLRTEADKDVTVQKLAIAFYEAQVNEAADDETDSQDEDE